MAVFFERSNRSNSNEQQMIGDIVRQCGVCQESDMVLRKKPDGNFMVGCLGYPQCRNVVWLPRSVSEAAVTRNICSTCNPGPVYMIQFKFRRLEIPPNYNVDHLGCIGGCDNILKQLVEICGTGSRYSSVPGRGQGNASSSSNAQYSTSRGQGSWQTAHSASSYPSHNSRGHDTRSQEANPQNGESSIPCTTCGAPCNLLTATTSANRGRKFYSCRAQGCNFFVWEDDANGGGSVPLGGNSRSTSNASRRGGRGRSKRGGRQANDVAFVSATGEPLSGRCFVCGDPSHFANACPSRGR